MQNLLLATDIDGTLIGDDAALTQLNDLIIDARKQKMVKLVYVTGRSKESLEQLQAEKPLMLVPDAVITGVGTEIYIGEPKQKLSDWPDIYGWNVTDIKSELASITSLSEQPASEQSNLRISYNLDNELTAAQVEQLLGNRHEIIYSGGLYLDILPRGVNKGTALQFLTNYWNLAHNEVVVCGDSENDISMINNHTAIIVGNAHPGLLLWHAASGQQDTYVASGKYAAGMIEGLQHFALL